MHQDIDRILISEEELKAKISELGQQLSKEYAGKNPLFLGVLKGCVVFFSDMIRAVEIPCNIDFMVVSSYGSGTSTSGTINMLKDVSVDIKGRNVVILEDIIDTGLTLKAVYQHLLDMEPASLKICALLDKPDRRKTVISAEYTGFTIPNEFVVGYGLDYNEFYRNLPYIGILKSEVYSK